MDLLGALRLCANVPGQFAIDAALHGEDTIAPLCAPGGRLYETRRAVIEAFAASEHLQLVAPAGALYAFPAVVGAAAQGFDDHRFALELLETEDVLVVPGSSFNVPYRNHFRVTLLPQPEDVREVFARIERVLDRHAAAPGRRRQPRSGVTQPRRRRWRCPTPAAACTGRPGATARHDATSRSATATPSAKAWPKPAAGRCSWPPRCARDGIALADPRIIATTGWTTDELAAAIDAAEPLGQLGLRQPADRRQQPVPRPQRGRVPRRVHRPARARDRLRRRPRRPRAGAVDPGLGRDAVRDAIAQQRGRDARRSRANSMPTTPPRRPSAPRTASPSSTSPPVSRERGGEAGDARRRRPASVGGDVRAVDRAGAAGRARAAGRRPR